MGFVTINPPAGLRKVGTDRQARGRWHEGHLVRFEGDAVKPMGGWTPQSATAIPGKARAVLTWRDNGGNRNIAVGAHGGLYRLNEAGTVTNLTPATFGGGDESATVNTGFGGGDYGTGDYGTPRGDSGFYMEASTWSLDTWGEHLVACHSKDGRLLQWTGTGTAAPIAGAPTGCKGLVVTDNRFLFALGVGGNARKIQWSDFQNNAAWTPTLVNQAGDEELQTNGAIQCAVRVRGGVLIITDIDAHLGTYVGLPAVWSFERSGDNCGAVSRKAIATVDGMAAWMGRGAFYVFDGFVRPIPCDVADQVFGDINDQQRSKVQAFALGSHPEVWWLYPSASSQECDRYVAWNYVENHWTSGALARTAGAAKGTFTTPIMVGTNGIVYAHETGFSYTGAEQPFVETAPLELSEGDRVLQATLVIPDERTLGDVGLMVTSALHPTGPESTASYVLANPTPVLASGRQIKLRFTGARAADWRVGAMRVNLKPRGKR